MKKIDVSYREWDLLDRLTDKASVAFTYMDFNIQEDFVGKDFFPVLEMEAEVYIGG